MWIQISFWYGLILIGVYSFVLPQSDAVSVASVYLEVEYCAICGWG